GATFALRDAGGPLVRLHVSQAATSGVWSRLRATSGVSVVDGVAFSRDGRTIATLASYDAVRLRHATTGRQQGDPLARAGSIFPVATEPMEFSPDGRLLAAGGWTGLTVWNTKTRRKQFKPIRHGQVQTLAFSPDSKVIA